MYLDYYNNKGTNNMERNEILEKVQDVFREELELDDLVIADETTADDVEEWDSLSHVQLVVALEKTFGIKFTSREILSWDNIGDLVDCIGKKL
jgi:acyl carrier protein